MALRPVDRATTPAVGAHAAHTGPPGWHGPQGHNACCRRICRACRAAWLARATEP